MLDNSTSAVVLFITCRDMSEAETISGHLVDNRLIACSTISADVTSVFRWQGEVDTEQEALIIAKSRKDLVPRIADEVKELHSYDLPEIIALPIVAGSSEYLQWITDETVSPDSD